jgi:hypothetical protein
MGSTKWEMVRNALISQALLCIPQRQGNVVKPSLDSMARSGYSKTI